MVIENVAFKYWGYGILLVVCSIFFFFSVWDGAVTLSKTVSFTCWFHLMTQMKLLWKTSVNCLVWEAQHISHIFIIMAYSSSHVVNLAIFLNYTCFFVIFLFFFNLFFFNFFCSNFCGSVQHCSIIVVTTCHIVLYSCSVVCYWDHSIGP